MWLWGRILRGRGSERVGYSCIVARRWDAEIVGPRGVNHCDYEAYSTHGRFY